MSGWIQNAIVAVLVVAAAIYATWLLLPSRSRLRLARWLGFNPKTSNSIDSACDRCSDNDKGKPPP